MVTCKDCLHNHVCALWRAQEGQDAKSWSDSDDWDCDYFADKSRFVELPCKVGDVVYYIEGACYNSRRQTVRPIEVTEISWKCDRSGRDLWFALIANGTRYKFSSIGKTVFLTREEAEAALSERTK